MHLVDGSASKAQKFHRTTCQDRYQLLYDNGLDTVFASLKDQFNQSTFVVYENIESFLLKTIKSEYISAKSGYIKRIYKGEVNITQFEIKAYVIRVIFYWKKVALIASSLTFENSSHSLRYSSIQPLPRQQNDRFQLKKNKNLDAFQNDPSKIQCVFNFAYI